jgi:hypothetical protein
VALAGCASVASDRDIFGNLYPTQCNPAVLTELHPTVIENAEREVILWNDGRGAGNYGGWVRPGLIVIPPPRPTSSGMRRRTSACSA